MTFQVLLKIKADNKFRGHT